MVPVSSGSSPGLTCATEWLTWVVAASVSAVVIVPRTGQGKKRQETTVVVKVREKITINHGDTGDNPAKIRVDLRPIS